MHSTRLFFVLLLVLCASNLLVAGQDVPSKFNLKDMIDQIRQKCTGMMTNIGQKVKSGMKDGMSQFNSILQNIPKLSDLMQ